MQCWALGQEQPFPGLRPLSWQCLGAMEGPRDLQISQISSQLCGCTNTPVGILPGRGSVPSIKFSVEPRLRKGALAQHPHFLQREKPGLGQ